MPRSKKSSQAGAKPDGQPWQLQTAKARFSELFRRDRTEGPQVVTRQGKEQVVVLPAEQFAQLTKRVRQPKSLVKFFSESPLARVTLDLNRDVDSGLEINLSHDALLEKPPDDFTILDLGVFLLADAVHNLDRWTNRRL
jgi:prevent-host-death family protein